MRTVALLAPLALVVAGCGVAADPGHDSGRPAAAGHRLTRGLPSATATATPAADNPDGADSPDGPGASDRPDPALSGQPTPTLPPGDPGTTTPPPTGHAPRQHVTAVPAAALLDGPSLAAVAGGTWVAATPGTAWCATPTADPAGPTRSVRFTAQDGWLVESVSSPGSGPAAVAAVASTSARLQQCGLVAERDPRLGQASEQLTGTLTDATGARQPVVALVLASEGVDLVLVAAGSAARPGAWESLADLALGSACAASGDGCH